MRDCLIVSGGRISLPLLKGFLEQHSSLYVIAADRGLSSLRTLNIEPDEIIGDFDSAEEETYEYARELQRKGIPFTKLNPVKDDTDTEAALQIAFQRTDGRIFLLGGTGSRMDHVLANLSVLAQGLERNREILLMDETNRIRLADSSHPVEILREEQYGTYLSVIPFGQDAIGVNLSGVFYPLEDARIPRNSSLGCSNEITDDVARISLREGILIVIESRD